VDVEGNQIILSVDLHAVSGKIEQPHTALTELAVEAIDALLHGAPVSIAEQGDSKSKLSKLGGDIHSIVDRIT
jgi:hypothetical protein